MVLEPRPPRRRVVPLVVALAVAVSAAAVAATQLLFRPAEERLVPHTAEGGTPPRGGEERSDFREALEDLLGGGGADEAGLVACVADDGIEPVSGPSGGGVRALAGHVERLRGLEFRQRVEPEFVSPEELASRIRRIVAEEYSRAMADAEARVLAALGAVPPDADLLDIRTEALGEEVAGFYLPRTGELVVRGSEEDLGVIDRITLVHELEHALADQNLELPVPRKLRPRKEDGDLAALALVEGDATLIMQRYVLTLPLEDQLGLIDPSTLAELQGALGDLPHYLRREFLFPYEDGLRFVCRLYAADGWAAVNAAYDDPPRSTAEVLFPPRYASGEEPVDPPDPPAPGPRWDPAGTRSFGAANLLWLFEAPGGEPGRALEDPRGAVRSWAGGEIHLWTRDGSSAVGVVLAERPGRDGLCDAVAEWYRAAFPEAAEVRAPSNEVLAVDGGAQDAAVVCTDDEVRLAIAPDLAIARRLTR